MPVGMIMKRIMVFYDRHVISKLRGIPVTNFNFIYVRKLKKWTILILSCETWSLNCEWHYKYGNLRMHWPFRCQTWDPKNFNPSMYEELGTGPEQFYKCHIFSISFLRISSGEIQINVISVLSKVYSSNGLYSVFKIWSLLIFRLVLHIGKNLKYLIKKTQTLVVPNLEWYSIFDFGFSNSRSRCPEVFLGKGVLKICCKFTGEDPCRSVISIELLCNFIEITLRHGFSPVNLQHCNFIEIALRHGCSPVNLQHIFRTPFPKNTFGPLLL